MQTFHRDVTCKSGQLFNAKAELLNIKYYRQQFVWCHFNVTHTHYSEKEASQFHLRIIHWNKMSANPLRAAPAVLHCDHYRKIRRSIYSKNTINKDLLFAFLMFGGIVFPRFAFIQVEGLTFCLLKVSGEGFFFWKEGWSLAHTHRSTLFWHCEDYIDVMYSTQST